MALVDETNRIREEEILAHFMANVGNCVEDFIMVDFMRPNET